ncbi:MAG TPA: hypothetical protein VGS23_07860 [Thermoplasmata archaeon]|nr:hypothetical protein [Thermoplasmata archaeon]
MQVCPACEAENPPGLPACRRCGLATELFEPIRAAVGLPKDDPRYEVHVRELLEAMGDLATPPAETATAGARLTAPARFPALSAARPDATIEPPELSIPGPLVRPAPDGIPELRRRIEEYLRLARRLGVLDAELEHRAGELGGVDDLPELERFATELYGRDAASLSASYRTELARRAELAELLPTGPIDGELATTRSELERGELLEGERTLRSVVEHLDRLEEEWGPATLLWMGANDLAGVIRDLGGDPSGALGPLSEGRRLMRELDRAGAERVLARAALGLWTVLNPILEQDLTRRIEVVRAHREAVVEVEPILNDLKEFAEQVTRRNFSAAVAYYRRGVDRLDQLAPRADGDGPPLNTAPPVRPA